MKARYWGCIFVSALFTLTAGNFTSLSYSQERSFQIEDWEKALNERQPPSKIMDAIGLNKGMIVGEVGAGTGRMTMWLADRVGESGKVYANDIDRSALDYLHRRCRRDGFKNVEIVIGKMENPGFPQQSLDIAFMINVYHHLANPVPVLKNLLPSLKSGGRLAIVECDPEKVDWGEEHGCSTRQNMIEYLKNAGFQIIRIETFLEEDNIYIAKPFTYF
jgi:ubiquinone/menaquinone biosynthesis C-methylase UbiE